MAPKGKSSATSGTRKKHARKAATTSGQVEEPSVPKEKKPKGKEKKKGKDPRKKVYIPPVKPAPVQPDPLDTLGIAQRLPPELLVVLRRLAKKDSVTKRRALEELQAGWVEKARTEGPGSELLDTLVDTIPVWVRKTSLSSLPCILTISSCIMFLRYLFTHPAASGCWQSACIRRFYIFPTRSGTRYSSTSAK